MKNMTIAITGGADNSVASVVQKLKEKTPEAKIVALVRQPPRGPTWV